MTAPDLSATVAARLRQARRDAGLTLEAVGTAVGHAGPTIGRYETGNRQPPLDTLPQLAAAVGVSLAWLLGIETNDQTTQEPS